MHLEMQFQHGRNSKVSKQAAAMQGTNYHHVEIEFVAAACGLCSGGSTKDPSAHLKRHKYSMAIRVADFSNGGDKSRKIFA